MFLLYAGRFPLFEQARFCCSDLPSLVTGSCHVQQGKLFILYDGLCEDGSFGTDLMKELRFCPFCGEGIQIQDAAKIAVPSLV
jgi:hypothetical protein